MATWAEFERAAPELAERGRKRFWNEVAYLATTGDDGAPFVHPVQPLIADGRLFIFVGLQTPKAGHLRRDPRYAIHAALGENDEEFIIRGRAVEADDGASRALAHRAAAEINMTTTNDVLMEFMIEHAHWAVWEGLGTENIRRAAKRWAER